MKVDKDMRARAGVIWAIIGVVVSVLLVIVAFSIDELNGVARILAVIMFVVSLVGLIMNLKVKKYVNVKDRLDDKL